MTKSRKRKSPCIPSSVLVTGGAGFIGSHSVERLLELGRRVRVLDNLSNGTRHNLPLEHPKLELRVGDTMDYDVVRKAMRGMHACLHLAAEVAEPWSVDGARESAFRNVIGFVNVLEAAREERIGKVVYASSAAVYGVPEELPLREATPPRPIDARGLEKAVNERSANLYHRRYGMELVGLRYFNVYGPRQSGLGVISKFLQSLQQCRSPTIFGDGRQARDFVHVYDVVNANLRALDCEYSGVCNVATGESTNLLDLLNVLCWSTGRYVEPEFAGSRMRDIRHSRGDIHCLTTTLGLEPEWGLEEGIGVLVAVQDHHELAMPGASLRLN